MYAKFYQYLDDLRRVFVKQTVLFPYCPRAKSESTVAPYCV